MSSYFKYVLDKFLLGRWHTIRNKNRSCGMCSEVKLSWVFVFFIIPFQDLFCLYHSLSGLRLGPKTGFALTPLRDQPSVERREKVEAFFCIFDLEKKMWLYDYIHNEKWLEVFFKSKSSTGCSKLRVLKDKTDIYNLLIISIGRLIFKYIWKAPPTWG